MLRHRFDGDPPTVEQVQDVVEQVLISSNHPRTARAYIVYRERAHGCARPAHAGRCRDLDQRVPRPRRLARQCQRQPGLFAGRADPQRLGQGDRQLLAVARLSARDRPGAPRGRPPHPRPRHAGRLLRRLVAAHAAVRGLQRRAGQGRGRAAEAPDERPRADGELPRHPAERMGRRAGVQLVRHLPGALRAQGPPELRRGAPGDPGVRLQPQRAVALGHADAVHQPDLRLGLPGGSARAGAGDRRRGNAVRLRRPAGRDGPDQPRLHRGDDAPATPRARVHLPDPDLQHHRRFSVGAAKTPTACST